MLINTFATIGVWPNLQKLIDSEYIAYNGDFAIDSDEQLKAFFRSFCEQRDIVAEEISSGNFVDFSELIERLERAEEQAEEKYISLLSSNGEEAALEAWDAMVPDFHEERTPEEYVIAWEEFSQKI